MNSSNDLYPSDTELSAPVIHALEARHLSYFVGGRKLLDGVSLTAEAGKLTVLIGPNGAGKSTTLGLLAGDHAPAEGEILFDGIPLTMWNGEVLARRRAVLPQSPSVSFAFRARDVVALGRHPHRGLSTGAEDTKAISWAMAAAGITRFADQECYRLSGGEHHRVHFARVLAQLWQARPDGKMRALLLDEPTAGLDLYHQHSILTMARTMAAGGAAVIVVLHDLDLAATYADHVVVLNHGRVADEGTPEKVLTRARIEEIWRMPCEILRDSAGRRHITIHPRGRNMTGCAAE